MDELRAFYESLGFGNPRSFIQSNVVFHTKERNCTVLAQRISAAILGKFKFRPQFMARRMSSLLGRELYIYFPNGMARPKLSIPAVERALKTACTGRNWNTVVKLLELAGSLKARK